MNTDETHQQLIFRTTDNESCPGAECQPLIQSPVTGLLLGPRVLFTLDAKLTRAFLSVVREEAEETVTTAW